MEIWKALNACAVSTLGSKNCLFSEIFACMFIKSPLKSHNKQMIGYPTMDIVSFVKIANVTHLQTLHARFTSILYSIPTKFDRLLVLVVIKMHPKF